MNVKKVISQLDSLRVYCKEAKELEGQSEGFPLWDEDIEAIDLAIEVLEKELSEKKIHVKAQAGVITAKESPDPDYPGIWILINDCELVLVEHDKEEFSVRVWAPEADDYAYKLVFDI